MPSINLRDQMGDDDIAYHHWLPSWYAEAQFSFYCLKKKDHYTKTAYNTFLKI
jgi:hypothetical protein